MKQKKRTKKTIRYIVIVFMIIALLLPITTNFLPQETSGQIDPKLLQAYIDSQNEDNKSEKELIEIPEIEGTYQVVDIPSGDALTIMWGDEKRDVKLIGVQEVSTTKEALKNHIENDFAQLEFDVIEEDENGNLLAYAYHPDGTFINYDLILHGNAKVKTNVTENTKHMAEFKDAQVIAKNNKVGCWEESNAREDKEK